MLFGATGMVGQGVLRECLLDPGVEAVLAVGRTPTGQSDPKLRELSRPDLFDLAPVEDRLCGYDACFFCLGVSSAGLNEADYRRLTFDLTVRIARTLAPLNPTMTFVYVSGAGTDSTEHGRVMWARVKGETENALRAMQFHAVYLFRPGVIRPLHGVRSKTRTYRWLYAVLAPFVWMSAVIAPNSITTTEKVGRAMIQVARTGAPAPVLGAREINRLGA